MTLTRKILVGIVVAFVWTTPVWSLGNSDIKAMVEAGFDDETIITAVKSKGGSFDTSVTALIELKNAGVSESVLRAVMDADAGRPVGDPKNTGLPSEVGVYLREDQALKEVEPEVVTWKTGGVMKSFLTGGITKGHTNGVVQGSHSRLQMSSPLEFVVVTTDGTSVVEYQLLRLNAKRDRREFRALTGGVIHASSGAKKNTLQEFQHEKVAPRTFVVRIAALKVGEYGFLPPGAVGHQSAVSMGKMYTFGVE